MSFSLKETPRERFSTRGVILLLVFLFSGCSTLTKQQCYSGNWFEYGRIDASNGRPEAFLVEHENACGAELSKAQEYKRGWSEGIKEFCSPNMGFHLGANGYRNPGYCPQELKGAFELKYIEGEKVWKLKGNLSELNDHLQEIEKNELEREQNKSTFEKVIRLMQDPNVVELRYSSIVRRQRDAIKAEIDKLEAPYQTPQMFKAPIDMGNARNGFGALVGTFVGFGSGHGIQRRYSEKGWWFTVGEFGSFFIPGSGAILGFLGFKVWESIDVWGYSYKSSLGYPDLKK